MVVAGAVFLGNALVYVFALFLAARAAPLWDGGILLVFPIVIDAIFGALFLKGKGHTKAFFLPIKTWALVRSLVGGLGLAALFFFPDHAVFMTTFQLAFMSGFLLLLLGKPGPTRILVAFVVIVLMLVGRGLILFAISTGRLDMGVKGLQRGRHGNKPAARK